MSDLVLFSDVGGLRGSGEPGPRPADVGGIRWVSVRVQHHGLLSLARICWVSAACTGQFDAFPAGVPDRKALLERVARTRIDRLYEGVLLGNVGLPGVVAVDGRFRIRWFDVHRQGLRRDEVIPGLPCCLITCGWLVRDSRCVCAAVCLRGTAGDRLQ